MPRFESRVCASRTGENWRGWRARAIGNRRFRFLVDTCCSGHVMCATWNLTEQTCKARVSTRFDNLSRALHAILRVRREPITNSSVTALVLHKCRSFPPSRLESETKAILELLRCSKLEIAFLETSLSGRMSVEDSNKVLAFGRDFIMNFFPLSLSFCFFCSNWMRRLKESLA